MLHLKKTYLRKAQLHSNPHEVGAFKIIGSKESNYHSPVIHGKKKGVNLDIESILQSLESSMKENETVLEVEITHTHPVYDLFVYNGLKDPLDFVFTPLAQLSSGDIEMAKFLSQKKPEILFTARAVNPNGYTYEISYLAGKVTESSQHLDKTELKTPYNLIDIEWD